MWGHKINETHATYLTWVDSIVHDLNPAFECGYLEQTQVRFADMIEVHWGVLPCVVFRAARIAIGYDLVTERRFVRVDALQTAN